MTTILSNTISAAKSLAKNLWLSISSSDFYRDVYKLYNGYGVKYLLTLLFISSVIYGALMLNYITEIKAYLDTGKVTSRTAGLDYLLNQLPTINYDGENISIEEDTPIYLTNIAGAKVIALDPDNKITNSEQVKIPMLFKKSSLVISFLGQDGKNINILTTSYKDIVNTTSGTSLAPNDTKKLLSSLLEPAITRFIYFFMPIFVLIYSVIMIMQMNIIFLPVLIYLVSSLSNIPITLKTCIRLALFSAGIGILLQPISFILPFFSVIIWCLQIWTSTLLVLGIRKVRRG